MPLLAGVVSAALNITRLSASSERLVLHGVEATRYTQAIVRQIAAMERSARLYQLLGRSELLDVFDENRRRMETVLNALETLPGDSARQGLIAELRRQTATVASGLSSGDRLQIAAALRNFGLLSQIGGQLSVLASRQIDRELIRLQEDTDRARTRLLWQSAALVPISLGLAFVFTLLLGRPIRDIDEAIRKLGHGELADPIRVRGTTDLEALGRQIEWLRQRLLEVSQERERFLRHMSHELKTPLANIREGTELLLDGSVGPLTQGQTEVAAILRENSLNLQRLIENLLSYSAWQVQSRVLSLGDVVLEPLVRSVLDSHHLSISAQRLTLRFEVAELVVRADRAKLRLIVENLLSNAIKFAPIGGTVLVQAGLAEPGWWQLEVADTGPGIPVADRPRVFEPFYQGDTPQTGYIRGTGIGLSVVHDFVAAHGGRIEFVEGGLPGAHIRVVLPLQPHEHRADVEKPYTAPALQELHPS
jgi:two-component system, NtrC family, sensor histidine kinase GlrK